MEDARHQNKKVFIQRLPNGEVFAQVLDPDGNVAFRKPLGHFTEEEYDALLETITDEIAVNLDI